MVTKKRMRTWVPAVASLTAALFASGCAGQGGGDAAEPQITGSPEESENSENVEDLAALEFDVAWQDAVGAAQDAFEGDLIAVELEQERGEWLYTIELTSNTQEFEAKISAESGELVGEEREHLEPDDAAEAADEVIEPDGLISAADAMTAATAEVAGAVHSWQLDGSWDGTFFDIEIQASDMPGDVEVTVDAETGDVVEIDD